MRYGFEDEEVKDGSVIYKNFGRCIVFVFKRLVLSGDLALVYRRLGFL